MGKSKYNSGSDRIAAITKMLQSNPQGLSISIIVERLGLPRETIRRTMLNYEQFVCSGRGCDVVWRFIDK